MTATGGESGAGIGGGYRGVGGTVTIHGGTVTATGGDYGAGIGGGDYGHGGTVTINGGTVAATGTNGAKDIGPGPDSTVSGANTFTGGSIRLVNDSIAPAPSNGTERVWCVTVTNLTPNAPVEIVLPAESLPDYFGVNDLYADEAGKLYLWLPDGSYAFTAGATACTATVAGADTTAVAGLSPPVFATDGTALVFSGTTLSITIANAQAGIWYTLYAVDTLGGDWELVDSLQAMTDGDLIFEDIEATAPRRFFKVEASTTQP